MTFAAAIAGARAVVGHRPAPATAAAAPARPQAAPRPAALLRPVGSAVSTLLLVAAAAAFLFLGVGPHVLGYRTATMLTGSPVTKSTTPTTRVAASTLVKP